MQKCCCSCLHANQCTAQQAYLVAPLSPTQGAGVGGEVAWRVHTPCCHHTSFTHCCKVLAAVAESYGLGLAPLSERHSRCVWIPGPDTYQRMSVTELPDASREELSEELIRTLAQLHAPP